jgi:S1-C subfamily serine protease
MQAGQRRVWVIAGAVAVGVIVLLGGILWLQEGRLGQVSEQTGELTANYSEHKGQVAELGGKIANLNKRVGETSNNTAALKGQVGGLRDKVAQVDGRVSGVSKEVAAVQGQVTGLNEKTGRLEGQVADLKAKPEREPPSEPSPSASVVYKQTLRSTAWICVTRAKGLQPSGIGVLVDRERRLLLTAYHVVAVGGQVRVYFPTFDGSDKAVAEPTRYLQRGTPIRGRVVVGDSRRDLAVIELDRVPADVPALPLAAGSPEPGDRVHSVGNPGTSQALWVYTEGRVRQVYRKKMRAMTPGFQVQEIDAWMVETQSPVNPGDSGGPVVNDRAELVAITSSFAMGARLVSNCVDLREIQAVLARYRP